MDPRQLLEEIASGDRSPLEIARRAGVSILELARIVTIPRNLEDLERVAKLHATQREMMLGRLKRDALTRLGELTDEVGAMNANEVRACEVMRKACGDLLRYRGLNTEKRHAKPEGPGGGGSRGYPGGVYHPEPLTPASEEKILEALEKWGEKIEEEEKEYPQIEDSPACPPGRGRMNRGGFKSGNENQYEPRVSGEPLGPPRRTSGSVALAGWSKVEPQATSGGRDGVEGVEVTQEVQVGMAFGKTSDHGTGEDSGHGTVTGGTPMPPGDMTSQAPPESPLPNDPGSRNGPRRGGQAGEALGSLGSRCRAPPSFKGASSSFREDVVFSSDHDPALAF